MPVLDQSHVSVVIPLYNKRDFIIATLQSVLSQSVPPLEVIIVDDGSRDGSDDLVESMAMPNLAIPIRLLRQQNAGAGAARNRGVVEAKGDWIAFIDGDDLWRSDHLSHLIAALRQFPQTDLVGTAYRRIAVDDTLPRDNNVVLTSLHDFYSEGTDARFCASSIAVRREALLSSGGFASFRLGEDTDLWIRLALRGPFALRSAASVGYVHDDSGLMAHAGSSDAGATQTVSPVFETIATLLADPTHAGRHAALADYSDRLRKRFAIQHLYRGQPAAARHLLRDMQRRNFAWAALWLSSLAAPRLLISMAWLWRRLRRAGF